MAHFPLPSDKKKHLSVMMRLQRTQEKEEERVQRDREGEQKLRGVGVGGVASAQQGDLEDFQTVKGIEPSGQQGQESSSTGSITIRPATHLMQFSLFHLRKQRRD